MLVVSSVSEAAGIHAFLGAFLVGIALADARATQDEAHEAIGRFVLSFAPINFVAMGMAANFIEHFDLCSSPSCSSSRASARSIASMALVTSLMAGPAMRWLLGERRS